MAIHMMAFAAHGGRHRRQQDGLSEEGTAALEHAYRKAAVARAERDPQRGGRRLARSLRDPEAASESSPAPLRIALGTSDGGLAVRVLKRRGALLAQPILLPSMPPAVRGKSHHVDRHPVASAAARDFSARLVHA